MKLKKKYSFGGSRQIWRILLTATDKLVIEERDTDNKEVFFSSLAASTGENIFKNYQLDEKFWVGIEAVHKDIIFFHKFVKPDMPGHKEIIAFDINKKKIIWQTNEYTFLFISGGKVFCFKQMFEGRTFYALDCLTGNLIEDLGDNPLRVNELREKQYSAADLPGYIFPEIYEKNSARHDFAGEVIESFLSKRKITGRAEFLIKGELILLNYHQPVGEKEMKNIFCALEINSGKVIFEEELNLCTRSFVPDSFFLKDELVFLLKEKNELLVYALR